MSSKIDRRRFLKKAGLTSVALGSLPALASAMPALAGDGTGFFLVTLSQAGPDLLVMAGAGHFDDTDIRGSGNFVHFVAATGEVVGAGRWKAIGLNDFSSPGAAHGFAAGILDADVVLLPEAGGNVAAQLRVACDLTPFGLPIDEHEGVSLTVGETTFTPLPEIDGRPFGLTAFTTSS